MQKNAVEDTVYSFRGDFPRNNYQEVQICTKVYRRN
nr:MAG TPA: hypothetical protein [Caudoviricetes sp.]